MWVALCVGFAVACGWGYLCYRAGRRAAQQAWLSAREKEYEQVDHVCARTAALQREQLLEQLRRPAQK